MKKIFYSLFPLLFLAAFAQSAEAIFLCGGVASEGQPTFIHGSGFYDEGRYFSSPVSNAGAVLLIAPDPPQLATPSEEPFSYFAVYHCQAQNGAMPVLQKLLNGYFTLPIVDGELPSPNWQIAADQNFSKCLSIQELMIGGTISKNVFLRHLNLLTRGDVAVPSVQIPTQLKLCVNAAGNLALTWGGKSMPTLYDIDEIGISISEKPSLYNLSVSLRGGKNAAEALFSFDEADQLALSDQRELFFAATGKDAIGQAYALGEDQRAVFVLNLDSLVVRFIGNAYTSSAQLAISADAQILVYRHLMSTRLQVARRDAADNYKLSNLSGVTGIYNPVVSADGRYIVFESTANLTGNSDGIKQIYRYDLKHETYQLVSSLADVPANSTCHKPAVSPDGRMITFVSDATNLLPAGVETDGKRYIFLADMGTDKLEAKSAGELLEGEKLTWEIMQELGIHSLVESSDGQWLDKNGGPLTRLDELQEKDFPLYFQAKQNVYNRVTVYLLSNSYRYELTILLNAMQSNLVLQTGWQLFSCPFALDQSSAELMLSNNSIFAWNTERQTFSVVREIAQLRQAGVGFFVYNETATSLEISGTRVKSTDSPSPQPGWQLRGPVDDGEAQNIFPQGAYFAQESATVFMLPENFTMPLFSAGWLFHGD